MSEQIYILFACDQWKSADSMRLACASIDPDKISDVIANEISEDNMSFFYGNSEEEDALDAFRKFRREGQEMRFVNSYLEYGHLEIVEDGEVL